jgi:hypothetical protein
MKQLNQQTFSTPQKTGTMVISRKVNKPHHPSLIMNNQQLEDVKYHKHLGVAISDDGSWNVFLPYFPYLFTIQLTFLP